MRTGSYISQGGNGILVRGIQLTNPENQSVRAKRLDEIGEEDEYRSSRGCAADFRSEQLIADRDLLRPERGRPETGDETAVGGGRLRLRRGGRPDAPVRRPPRAYGTFPRILGHYVRDEHLFPLEEAVRKMTSLAASRAKFADRGMLRAGMRADVVVFNPATIRDVSTYEDPHHFAEGISNVIVNGVPVLQDGKMTGRLGGRVLRRGSS